MVSTHVLSAEKLDKIAEYLPDTGVLAEVNRGFHEAYEELVSDVLAQLGRKQPVLMAIEDELKLFADGRERSEGYLPEEYHQLKAISHVAFGVQLTLASNGEGQLKKSTARRLQALLDFIEAAEKHLLEQHLSHEALEPSKAILRMSRTLAVEVMDTGTVQSAAVADFARQVCPFLTTNISIATRRDLDRLHQIVTAWREELGEKKWSKIYVVICRGHQMRNRQATKQYFLRLLHEREGMAAELEDRVVYVEGCREVAAALDTLARHIIDQQSSRIFFGDRHRLQTDLLADAASEYLKELLPDV